MKNQQMLHNVENVQEHSKRQFLKGVAALMGVTAASSLLTTEALAAAFTYEASENSQLKAGKLFSQQQMMILHDICDVVLPKTDTPSAAELDVHGFLDHQLFVCFSADVQKKAVNLVKHINEQSQQHFSEDFVGLSNVQQTQLLERLEATKFGFTEEDSRQFKGLKSLIVFGFFTTEVGATQVLNYQAVPGGFKGSVSYSSLKKSWGSLGFY